MSELVPDESIPRGPDHQILRGGFFCVAHTSGRLRLIFDRRPQNGTEELLDWLDLPSGTQLAHLQLDPPMKQLEDQAMT